MEEHVIKTERRQLEVFFKSEIWKDIIGLLKDGISDGQEELESKELGIEETAFLRGRLFQIRRLLELEETVLELKDVQEEETSNGNE